MRIERERVSGAVSVDEFGKEEACCFYHGDFQHWLFDVFYRGWF